MVLCEISNLTNSPVTDFLISWGVLTLLGGVSMAVLSGSIFYYYYCNVSYDTWTRKLNPEFPTPQKVRLEIRQMLKSLLAATLVPALTLILSQEKYKHLGLAKAYCGYAPAEGVEVPWGLSAGAYLVAQFLVFWVVSDFFEWAYHQVGHRFSFTWAIHRHHHVFYNPSPFSVISDEWADQLVRTSPLLFIPMALPTNIDLLFAQFALLFYAYGVYLHWGYETPLISAHNPIINGSYEHYYHHAFSGGSTPIFTGFFFKCWDQMVGTVATGECVCTVCEIKRGKRSPEAWKKVVVPDYSVLLSTAFWAERDEVEGGKKVE